MNVCDKLKDDVFLYRSGKVFTARLLKLNKLFKKVNLLGLAGKFIVTKLKTGCVSDTIVVVLTGFTITSILSVKYMLAFVLSTLCPSLSFSVCFFSEMGTY